MINVGFIGCGRIADLHALGYRNNPRARIYAVCDADPECAARRKSEWGAEKTYTDYRDLMQDPNVHAVEVLTPYDTHEPIVIAAASAGKHIACQKPMTTSLASAARMVAAAEEAKVVFRVTEMYVTYPPIALAKDLIQEGVYGEPVGMRIKYVASPKGGWHVPPSTYEQQFRIASTGHGFETFDHGHHEWAVGWYLLGDVERVAAWVDSLDGIVDAPATVMWKCRDNKRYGVCDFTFPQDLTIPTKYYPNDEWFEITCSRGIIVVNRGTGAIKEGPPVTAFDGEKWTDYNDVPCDWAEGFIAATHNFISAINGEAAPLLTAREGEKVLRFALAVERAASSRREVYLDEFDQAFPAWYAWRRRRRERKGCIVGPRPRKWLRLGGATEKYAPQAHDLTLGMVDRFDASAVRDWECVLALHLDGEGGASDQDYGVYVKDGKADIRPNDTPHKPVLSLRIPAGTWAAILLGKKRLELALMQGKIKYDGRAEEGLRLRSAFKI